MHVCYIYVHLYIRIYIYIYIYIFTYMSVCMHVCIYMGNNRWEIILKSIHIVPSYCSVSQANPIPRILICLHLGDGKTFQTFASLDTATALTSISFSILNCN